jgi:hypothetical protein
MKLYQYAVILHPTKKDREDGKLPELLVKITETLAETDNAVAILASREIPQEHLDKLDRIEVAVRPF